MKHLPGSGTIKDCSPPPESRERVEKGETTNCGHITILLSNRLDLPSPSEVITNQTGKEHAQQHSYKS